MEQEQLYLTNKHALLSGGGSMLQDNYYTVLNSTSSLVETTYNLENLIALPSVQMGSSTSVSIQNFNFLGRIMLHLQLKPLQNINQSICRAWGYAILQSISWTMGASSTSQITLIGDSILQTAMAQIDNPEKRDEVLRLAGEENYTFVHATTGPVMDCYVMIPTPFSTWCDKLPYDSSLLSQPVVINIQFNQASAIYGGIGGDRPDSFRVAEVLIHSGELTNKALSLKNKMIADPTLISPYPFSHFQNFISPMFVGKLETTALRGCEVQLTSFTNSDITGIICWIVRESDKNPSNSNTPNPYNLADFLNVQLIYNGKIIFNIPRKGYKFTNMLGDQGPSYIPYSLVTAGNTGPFSSSPVNVYPLYIDFSRLRSTCMLHGMQHMFNTWRLSNQNLYLRFNTPDEENYRLYATYVYNACAETQNGVTSIYID